MRKDNERIIAEAIETIASLSASGAIDEMAARREACAKEAHGNNETPIEFTNESLNLLFWLGYAMRRNGLVEVTYKGADHSVGTNPEVLRLYMRKRVASFDNYEM
jgi:hypothetical protein